MNDLISNFLHVHSDEIVIGVITTLIAGAVVIWFQRIKSWSWKAWVNIKRSYLNARPKLLRALGVAPIEDIKAVEVSFKQASAVDIKSGPASVVRFGLRLTLDKQIWKSLGNSDPFRMPSDTINDLIHGPFCFECFHTLVFVDRRLGSGVLFSAKCPACKWEWKGKSSRGADNYSVEEIKAMVYRALDAEFLRTGMVTESETPLEKNAR